MQTLITELQYKKSQYESLYSMRIKKFLSAKCPVWSGICLSYGRRRRLYWWVAIDGGGAVRAGRGLNCCWFFWIARKPNYSLRVIKKANCTLTAGCCPLKMHMDHQDHHRHIYSHFSKYINEHIITNTGGRLPEKPSGSLDWLPIVSLHYTIIHY